MARLFASLVLLVAVVASVAVAQTASAAPASKLCTFPSGYTVFDTVMASCVALNDPSSSHLSATLQPDSTDPCYGAWTASNKAALSTCFSKLFVMNCNVVCIGGTFDLSGTRMFAQSQCDGVKTACDAAFTSTSCNMNSHHPNYTISYFTSTACAATATPAGFPAITAVSSTEVDKLFSGIAGSSGSSASSVVANVALVIAAFVALLF